MISPTILAPGKLEEMYGNSENGMFFTDKNVINSKFYNGLSLDIVNNSLVI